MSAMLAILIAAQTGEEGVRRTLETRRVSVDFRDSSLFEAVAFFRDFTGLNILVGRAVEDARVTLKLKDVSARSALKLLLHPLGLAATAREGVLVILPKSELRKKVTLRVYDVRDLVCTLQDFEGPKIELAPSRPGIIIPPGIWDHDPVPEDAFLLEVVKNHIEGDESTSVEFAHGVLFVTQTREGHEEVSSLLARLRLFQ